MAEQQEVSTINTIEDDTAPLVDTADQDDAVVIVPSSPQTWRKTRSCVMASIFLIGVCRHNVIQRRKEKKRKKKEIVQKYYLRETSQPRSIHHIYEVLNLTYVVYYSPVVSFSTDFSSYCFHIDTSYLQRDHKFTS